MLTDPDGRPLARFLAGERDGVPLADLLEPVGDPEAAATAVLEALRGWQVAGDSTFGRRLIAHGATPRRHSYAMTRDLVTDPPPPAWSAPPVPDGVRLTPADRAPAELVPAFAAAFPPSHPDFAHGGPPADPERELGALMDGRSLGPLLPCSGLAVRGDAVVGAILVNAQPGEPPFGGAWIGELFRDPALPGIGTALLRRALALAAADGVPGLGLAVTHGNRAERLYAAHGFRATLDALSVTIPGEREGPA